MKSTRSITTLSIISLLILAISLACKGNFSTGNNSSNSTPATDSPANSSSSSNSASPAGDISGKYNAVGTNPDGKGEYKAGLEIVPHGDVYEFTWTSGKSTYNGVGVMTDNQVAVSFVDNGIGKGCGVVLYKMGANNTLEGKVGYWGSNTMETETATRTDGAAKVLDGVYAVNGKNPKGEPYKAELTIAKSGEGYTFDWTGASNFSGFGITGGDYIAVGFGGKQCSFVGYDVKADGTLEGNWGSQATRKLGTETATKQ